MLGHKLVEAPTCYACLKEASNNGGTTGNSKRDNSLKIKKQSNKNFILDKKKNCS